MVNEDTRKKSWILCEDLATFPCKQETCKNLQKRRKQKAGAHKRALMGELAAAKAALQALPIVVDDGVKLMTGAKGGIYAMLNCPPSCKHKRFSMQRARSVKNADDTACAVSLRELIIERHGPCIAEREAEAEAEAATRARQVGAMGDMMQAQRERQRREEHSAAVVRAKAACKAAHGAAARAEFEAEAACRRETEAAEPFAAPRQAAVQAALEAAAAAAKAQAAYEELQPQKRSKGRTPAESAEPKSEPHSWSISTFLKQETAGQRRRAVPVPPACEPDGEQLPMRSGGDGYFLHARCGRLARGWMRWGGRSAGSRAPGNEVIRMVRYLCPN